MDAFIGEIRPFAFGWAPANWILCNGQSLYIPQYQTLYAVIGNVYGSTPIANTFKVPDLMGSAIISAGQQAGATVYNVGDAGGSESVALSTAELPAHNHSFSGATGAGTARKGIPADNTYCLSNIAYNPSGTSISAVSGYVTNPPTAPNTTLNPLSVTAAGGGNGGQAAGHENRQPYLVVGYYICTVGNYPTRP